MGTRQRETILNLRVALEAANDEIRRLRKQQEYLRAQVDSLRGFAMRLGSAELARIDRYLETVLEETSNE